MSAGRPLRILDSLLLLLLLAGALTRCAPAVAAETDLTFIPLPANHLLYDPATARIYASIPSRAGGAAANGIAIIDPATGMVEQSVYIGSEPGRMILSAKGKYLYVALNGSDAVRRFELATRTPGQQFSLEGLGVGDLLPFPDDPDSVVVMRRNRHISPSDEGVAVYTNGTARPGIRKIGNSLAAGITPYRFYSYENTITSFGLATAKLGKEGVSHLATSSGLISGFNVSIMGANGLIFTNNGAVIDPEARQTVGRIPNTGWGSLLCPDPSLGRIFQITSKRGECTFHAYDLKTLVEVQNFNVTIPGGAEGVGNLMRWGARGLAFTTSKGIVLLRADLGTRLPEVDLSISRSEWPADTRQGGDVTYHLTVANLGRASASAAFLSETFPKGVDVLSFKASQGTVSSGDHILRVDLGKLAAGARAYLNVTVRLGAAEKLPFTAAVRGNEPDPRPENNVAELVSETLLPAPPIATTPAAPVPPVGALAADLTGTWKSLSQQSAGAGVDLQATVGGTFVVRNSGKRAAGPTRLRFFLSEGPRYIPLVSRLLQEVAVPALPPGQEYTAVLKARLQRGNDALGLHVIAVVNADGAVAEVSKRNNQIPREIQ